MMFSRSNSPVCCKGKVTGEVRWRASLFGFFFLVRFAPRLTVAGHRPCSVCVCVCVTNRVCALSWKIRDFFRACSSGSQRRRKGFFPEQKQSICIDFWSRRNLFPASRVTSPQQIWFVDWMTRRLTEQPSRGCCCRYASHTQTLTDFHICLFPNFVLSTCLADFRPSARHLMKRFVEKIRQCRVPVASDWCRFELSMLWSH